MTRDEYQDWIIANIDRDDLEEPISTLVAHIIALHERLDKLPGAYGDTSHDGCKEYDHQCACAYDYPEDMCMVHWLKSCT